MSVSINSHTYRIVVEFMQLIVGAFSRGLADINR